MMFRSSSRSMRGSSHEAKQRGYKGRASFDARYSGIGCRRQPGFLRHIVFILRCLRRIFSHGRLCRSPSLCDAPAFALLNRYLHFDSGFDKLRKIRN